MVPATDVLLQCAVVLSFAKYGGDVRREKANRVARAHCGPACTTTLIHRRVAEHTWSTDQAFKRICWVVTHCITCQDLEGVLTFPHCHCGSGGPLNQLCKSNP